MSAIPIGTLIQKIHCQESPSTTAPPTRGPTATASPPSAPQMPRATLRRAAGTPAERRVKESGTMSAPPAPWRARAATRTSMLGARAAAADEAVNSASPTMNIRRRPKRSPSAAPVSSSTAKLSVNALTVHSSPARPVPRLRRITGSAVVTTRLSSAAMNCATPVTRTAQNTLERLVWPDRRIRGRTAALALTLLSFPVGTK